MPAPTARGAEGGGQRAVVSRIIIPCISRDPVRKPIYATPEAAGADLAADIEAPITLAPGERRLIGTGVRLAIPKGFEGQIRPRSGLALAHGVTLLNSPGTVDSDYRGEISLLLINLGSEPFLVLPGERIGQIVIAPIVRASFVMVSKLTATGRGGRGFGSTGR